MNKHLSYMPKLDGLRAIAALMVLVAHYMVDVNSSLHFDYGGNGVQIFFTISGFLITYILLSQKNRELHVSKPKMLGLFMLKRALRLFPIYYIFIIILFTLSKFGGLWLTAKGTEWYYFAYLQNYLFYKIDFQSNLLNHTWSLAVEEQFYILWPLLIFYIPKKLEVYLLGLIFILGLVVKYYLYYYYIGNGTTKGVTFMHFDTLGIGALLAYTLHYKKLRVIDFLERYSSSLFIVTFMLTALFTFFELNDFMLSFFLTLMSLFVVFIASSNKVYFLDSLLNLNVLRYLGKISYGIYLYHKPVPFFINYFFAKAHFVSIENKFILFIIYTTVALLVAIISWNTIEKYFLKLKDKIN